MCAGIFSPVVSLVSSVCYHVRMHNIDTPYVCTINTTLQELHAFMMEQATPDSAHRLFGEQMFARNLVCNQPSTVAQWGNRFPDNTVWQQVMVDVVSRSLFRDYGSEREVEWCWMELGERYYAQFSPVQQQWWDENPCLPFWNASQNYTGAFEVLANVPGTSWDLFTCLGLPESSVAGYVSLFSRCWEHPAFAPGSDARGHLAYCEFTRGTIAYHPQETLSLTYIPTQHPMSSLFFRWGLHTQYADIKKHLALLQGDHLVRIAQEPALFLFAQEKHAERGEVYGHMDFSCDLWRVLLPSPSSQPIEDLLSTLFPQLAPVVPAVLSMASCSSEGYRYLREALTPVHIVALGEIAP